ncbi:unnamed protein product [Boreogadus saida]
MRAKVTALQAKLQSLQSRYRSAQRELGGLREAAQAAMKRLCNSQELELQVARAKLLRQGYSLERLQDALHAGERQSRRLHNTLQEALVLAWSEERLAVMAMGVEDTQLLLYPRLIPLHNMELEGEAVPSPLRGSEDRLSDSGAFLLENGHALFLWLGQACPPRAHPGALQPALPPVW